MLDMCMLDSVVVLYIFRPKNQAEMDLVFEVPMFFYFFPCEVLHFLLKH